MSKSLIAILVAAVSAATGVLAVGAKPSSPPGQAKKAVVGSVEDISGSSLTIEDKTNRGRTQAAVDSTTAVIGPDNRPIKLGALKLKDTIAAVASDSASATAGGKLKIKKIFVADATASAALKRHAVMGIITAINGNTLTLAHQIKTDQTTSVLTNSQTVIKFKSLLLTGSASPSATPAPTAGVTTPASLAIGQRIVAVGTPSPEGLVAKLIHIIPGQATGVFNRQITSTPSATLSPTLSPTPSVSVTPSPSPTLTVTPSPSPTPSPTPSSTPTPTP